MAKKEEHESPGGRLLFTDFDASSKGRRPSFSSAVRPAAAGIREFPSIKEMLDDIGLEFEADKEDGDSGDREGSADDERGEERSSVPEEGGDEGMSQTPETGDGGDSGREDIFAFLPARLGMGGGELAAGVDHEEGGEEGETPSPRLPAAESGGAEDSGDAGDAADPLFGDELGDDILSSISPMAVPGPELEDEAGERSGGEVRKERFVRGISARRPTPGPPEIPYAGIERVRDWYEKPEWMSDSGSWYEPPEGGEGGDGGDAERTAGFFHDVAADAPEPARDAEDEAEGSSARRGTGVRSRDESATVLLPQGKQAEGEDGGGRRNSSVRESAEDLFAGLDLPLRTRRNTVCDDLFAGLELPVRGSRDAARRGGESNDDTQILTPGFLKAGGLDCMSGDPAEAPETDPDDWETEAALSAPDVPPAPAPHPQSGLFPGAVKTLPAIMPDPANAEILEAGDIDAAWADDGDAPPDAAGGDAGHGVEASDERLSGEPEDDYVPEHPGEDGPEAEAGPPDPAKTGEMEGGPVAEPPFSEAEIASSEAVDSAPDPGADPAVESGEGVPDGEMSGPAGSPGENGAEPPADGAAKDVPATVDPASVFAAMDSFDDIDAGLDDDVKAMLDDDGGDGDASAPPEAAGASAGTAGPPPAGLLGRLRWKAAGAARRHAVLVRDMVAWRENWWLYCDLLAVLVSTVSLAVISAYFLWYR